MRVVLPGFKYQGSFALLFLTFFLIWLGAVTGWLMNIQNLWQYWPQSNCIIMLGDVPLQWIVSAIGVFIAPIGAVTGWVW